LDPVEQVVVDFSSVKKQIKQIIDDKETGFDHKLWFIEKYSNGDWYFDKFDKIATRITIITPTTEIRIPRNAVTIISERDIFDYSIASIGVALERKVQAELRVLHPHANITVKCINNQNCHYPTQYIQSTLFRYTHGLKDSTSWGCQNVAHGHLSYIQAIADGPNNEQQLTALESIGRELDDTVFIMEDNISHASQQTVTVDYTTGRGQFLVTYRKDAYKLSILETETTVEHLVEFIAAKYGAELKELGVIKLFVSEGLSKGAFVTL